EVPRSGHTRTMFEPGENANTPNPHQSIQCELPLENARITTTLQSSRHSLTLRPVSGARPSEKTNVSIVRSATLLIWPLRDHRRDSQPSNRSGRFGPSRYFNYCRGS